MLKRLSFISLISLLSIDFGWNAQELTLEMCLKMADTANLTLRNAQLDILINDKQRDAYLATRLPQVTFVADYKYNAIIPGQVVPGEFFGGPPGTFSTVQFGVPYTLGNTLQLSQILFNSQVNYGLAALKINAKIVEIQKDITHQEVKQQVANTYFNLHALNKQLDYIKGNLVNMDQLIKNMQAMVDQELMVSTEVDKLQINKLTLVNSKATIEASVEQLSTLLKILIGMPSERSIALAPDEMVQKSLLTDLGAVVYPELKLIEAQQEMNKEERKGLLMGYLPNLVLYGSYNYNYNTKPEDDFRTGIEGAAVGLRLDWTLFDGLEKAHKQKQNKFNKEKLANQYELAEQQLSMKATAAKKQIDVQVSSLDIAKEQLKLAQRVYDQTKLKFEQGVVSSNDMLTADNALQQAQSNVVATYVQLRQAELEYLKTIGNLK
jgi:outer membrane protein